MIKKKLHTIILAGGSGKRLWPVSTSNYPKQFSIALKSKSLFELTLERAKSINSTKVSVSCNISHEFETSKWYYCNRSQICCTKKCIYQLYACLLCAIFFFLGYSIGLAQN